MKTYSSIAVLVVALVLGISDVARAQSKDQLGKVDFQNSCSPGVQESFQRAVAMLHSFRYGETEKAFREVLVQDPSCAISTWGIAAILMSNPLAGIGPSPQWAERAKAAIDQGRKIGAKTQRERDYVEAVAAYYEDWANRPERTRQLNRARAFEALAARYPTDDEAQIFHALYLAATQSLADQSYKTYLTAAETLEKQFAKHPDHPGIAHYLIHSYDAPPIAPKGLPAARRYAGIAPSAPHALHMPSHIFTRVGLWQESVSTNHRAAAAATGEAERSDRLHALDYLVYADLQLARDGDAKAGIELARQTPAEGATVVASFYSRAAVPARYAIERGQWAEAARLDDPDTSKFPYADAMRYFARALGTARNGNPDAAEKDVARLREIAEGLKAAKNAYWATEVEVERTGAEAWVAFAKGQRDQGLSLMRAAADMEDKSEKAAVSPGRLIPARELLGDMLLESGRPADALVEYEASQTRDPRRFRGFWGAGQAAAQAGNKDKARDHFTRLVEMTGSGDPRPELAKAREYLAMK